MSIIEFIRCGGLLHVAKHVVTYPYLSLRRCLDKVRSARAPAYVLQPKTKRDCEWIPPPRLG
jgi:hypothetical protein